MVLKNGEQIIVPAGYVSNTYQISVSFQILQKFVFSFCYFEHILVYFSLPVLSENIKNFCPLKYLVRKGRDHFFWSGLKILFKVF